MLPPPLIPIRPALLIALLLTIALAVVVAMQRDANAQPINAPYVGGVQAVAVGSGDFASTRTGTWFMIRGFAPPPYGSVICFENQNDAGVWQDNLCLNGGTMVGTPGNEQGDLDIWLTVDGKLQVVAVSGRWAGSKPGVIAWPPDIMWLGTEINRFAGLGLTEVPCPPSAPSDARSCIRANDGFIPLYR